MNPKWLPPSSPLFLAASLRASGRAGCKPGTRRSAIKDCGACSDRPALTQLINKESLAQNYARRRGLTGCKQAIPQTARSGCIFEGEVVVMGSPPRTPGSLIEPRRALLAPPQLRQALIVTHQFDCLAAPTRTRLRGDLNRGAEAALSYLICRPQDREGVAADRALTMG